MADDVAGLDQALECLAQVPLVVGYGWATRAIRRAIIEMGIAAECFEELAHRDGERSRVNGLLAAYDLLVEIDDPLGRAHKRYWRQVLDSLQARNASFFAHGYIAETGAEFGILHAIVLKYPALELHRKQFGDFDLLPSG